LLFKLYKLTNKKKGEIVKALIIKDFPETKFSKILQNSNNLVLEDEVLIKRLDSFKVFFEKQKFEKVIKEIDTAISFIENKELIFDYELLKASSIGRLEGILIYEEKLKELIVKYPNSVRKNEIQKIIHEINKKWKIKKEKELFGKALLVYVLDKKQDQKKVLDRLVSIINRPLRFSVDVYDYEKSLLVVRDFENKEKANKTRDQINKNIEFLRLKNNFVVLSSQYKNMLIYKTLDLYEEN
jgi:hypothetical protein